VLELLLDLTLVVGGALERAKPGADAGGAQIVRYRFGDARVDRVAGEVARVEAVGIAGFGQELLGPGEIVRNGRRLPVVLEVRGDEAVVEARGPERLGLVDRLAIDGVVGGETKPAVVPGRFRVPLVDEVDPVAVVRERGLEREPRSTADLLAQLGRHPV